MIVYRDEYGGFYVHVSIRHPATKRPKSRSRYRNDKNEPILTEAEARRIEKDIRREIQETFTLETTGIMPYRELLSRFYESLRERDLANATIENYRLCLDAHTLQLWGHRPIDSIRAEEIRQLIKVKLGDRSRSHQKSVLKFVRGCSLMQWTADFYREVPFRSCSLGSVAS